MATRDTSRRCPRPGCFVSMAGRAPQSRWCSDACKQAAYRLRKPAAEAEDDRPAPVYEAPAVASAVRTGDGWTVHFADGQQVQIEACAWEGQARARARWRVAQRVEF